jgi:predicted phage tail protein
VLHGYLKDLCPGDIELDASSVRELINGLCKQTKAFDPKPRGRRHAIQVVGMDTLEQINGPIPESMKEVHLVPAVFGGKRGGLFQIIIGAVLIAAAVATGNPWLAEGGLKAGLTFWGTVGVMGIALVLGGLLQLLSASPKADDKSDPLTRYLGAPGNTVKIGTRIPIIYGRHKVFGHYISFDIGVQKETNPVDYNPLGSWNEWMLTYPYL